MYLLKRKMEIILKKEILELKNTILEIKMTSNRLNRSADIENEYVGKLKKSQTELSGLKHSEGKKTGRNRSEF